MRFTSIILAAAAFFTMASAAPASAAPAIPDWPQCSMGCMADAIEYYDCPLNDDFACACGKIEEIRVAAMNCLVGACKPFEVRKLERQARQYCAGS